MPPKNYDAKINALKKQLDTAKQEQKIQKLVEKLTKKAAPKKKAAAKPKGGVAKKAKKKPARKTGAGGEKTVKIIMQMVAAEKPVAVPVAPAAQ
jgi:hypothetical protein